jgi:hypothetical protein
MTMRVLSGAQYARAFSPCSIIEVGVLEKKARTVQGLQGGQSRDSGKSDIHTRTRQTDTPFLVSVQKKALRGLGHIASTGSGGRFGSDGTVHIRRAAEVGKYMESSAQQNQPTNYRICIEESLL